MTTTDSQRAVIRSDALARRLADSAPENSDPRRGFALVCVSHGDEFEAAHIPGAINIPEGLEEVFDQRYDRTKEIVVYGEGDDDRPTRVVERLHAREYRRAIRLEGGLTAWREGDRRIETGSQQESVGEHVRRAGDAAGRGESDDLPLPPRRL